MATYIFEVYSAKSGRAVGYLTADEEETAGTMQRAGYIVDKVEV